MTVRVHIKNNHAHPDSFPPTPESEPVFTTTRERYDAVLASYPDLQGKLDTVIDWDTENFAESMKTAEALMCWDLPTEDLRDVAPNLKWIHIIGAGVEHLCPMDWAPEGLVITNNKGAQAAKAGDFGLMAVLMLHSHIPAIASNQRSNEWNSLYSTPIEGRTVLIVGVGSLGGGAAKQLKKLGIHVLGVSRHGNAHADVDEMGTMADLDAFLPRADYIFVSVPMTPETVNLMNRDRLSAMKPGSGIINIGRAATMDYDALVDLLGSGHLDGAILDVFDPEPLPLDSPLWTTPNLMVMPHISADDGETYIETTLTIFLNNMRRFIAGEELNNLVRPDLGY
ncbi:MAG: D-2-hydroxyacid dehydrogenase [Rhodospirillaceae bacterium]|nr:D-2-hydroxyacid dehydrogenase [Rhodospirillaceae bacterium]|tara:strand:+ start:1618 stop:2634 length:1017 start_codon:yes stop_codon:yes gene_type:complete